MKNKCIIFLLSFLFVINQSFPHSESHVSKDEVKNIEVTHEAMEMVEKIIDRLEHKDENSLKESEKEAISKPFDNPDLFEGDMVLSPNQAEDVVEQIVEQAEEKNIDVSDIVSETKRRRKRKIQSNVLFQWELPISYYVEKNVGEKYIDEYLKGMENETCIRFKKETSPIVDKPGLIYYKGDGCHSMVGRVYANKPQQVSIGMGCENLGTVQHETMHALGSVHEQSRADRNEYLNIFLDNVDPIKQKNFLLLELENALTYETKYDYGSTMQYPTNAFSKNKQSTMLPKDSLYTDTLGINAGLSFLDAKLLNSHYCKNKCSRPITCLNGGYQDPNNCNICKCVEGYYGTTCSDFPPDKMKCGDSFINLLQGKKFVYALGSQTCIYHIKTKENQKLKITFNKLKYVPVRDDRCFPQNSLEVKYLEDKTVTGALLCRGEKNYEIMSKNNHVILYHRSTIDTNMIEAVIEVIEK